MTNLEAIIDEIHRRCGTEGYPATLDGTAARLISEARAEYAAQLKWLEYVGAEQNGLKSEAEELRALLRVVVDAVQGYRQLIAEQKSTARAQQEALRAQVSKLQAELAQADRTHATHERLKFRIRELEAELRAIKGGS